jgi:putative nucleotidyltransferase with HDIG domain
MSEFPMLLKQQDFYKSLTVRFPGLVERIRRLIEESEKKFTAAKSSTGGFLWEHTVLVASLSFRLAKMEKEDADLAALIALFHDSGKFSGGRYHRDEKPEEEAAARLAREVLEEAELGMADIGHVVRGLRSLYNSGVHRNRLADIIHDADFLSKFGLLGVAEFFVKSTLRGRNLEAAIMNHLSKELTYASVLPRNMRTESARRLAARKSGETLRFYRNFLAELKEAHGMDFKVRTPEVRRCAGRLRRLKVMLVTPAVCGSCGRGWEFDFRTEKGVKCERLEAGVRCPGCATSHQISFCLPEIV